MRKNKMMRLASMMLVLTMLSTCAISGTLAKYVSTAGSEDTARVAYWGFKDNTMDIKELFKQAYDTTVKGDSEVNSLTDVIAPGTTGSATFAFAYAGDKAPEVAYTFEVSTDGSTIAESIENNPNILWKLDDGAFGTWNAMITAIEALDGNEENNRYEPNTLPTEFTTANDAHTITWKWIFDEKATAETEPGTTNNDANDTTMGNVTATELAQVKVVINITATQIN